MREARLLRDVSKGQAAKRSRHDDDDALASRSLEAGIVI
jgi:hypothetical protein